MDEAAEEGAGGEHDRPGGDLPALGRDHAGRTAIGIQAQVLDRGGANFEPLDFREEGLHRGTVELAVGLGAGPAHGRALAAVEHAELDAGAVGGAAHQPVERVDLAHELALGQPADRRVARHLADGVEAMGEEQRGGPHARGGGRRLAARVPAAHDDDVVAW